jgi:AraC family transcriptional regulator
MRDCGLMTFTITGHGLAVYPPGATFGPRLLRDFEFVWIVDGDVASQHDEERHDCPPGTVLLGRPGMRDRYEWDQARTTRHGYVHFLLDLNGARLPPQERWPLVRLPEPDDIMRPLFRHLAWLLAARPSGWEELAQGALRQALMAFISGGRGVAGEEGEEGSPLVDAVMAHVAEQWSGGALAPLTLRDLARVAGVTPGHLVRVFRRVLDATPMQVLRLLRLDRAATLLARSNLAVQAVAEQTGFASPFHFSRQFRAAYGHSPREFRRRVAAGMDRFGTRHRFRELSARLWQTR